MRDLHLAVVSPSADIDRDDGRDLARALAAEIDGEIRFGRHDRMLYATDASIFQVEPIGVVLPRSTADAAKAVRFCAAQNVAILPRGGGTSLAGQAVNRALVIDFSKYCRGVLSIDPDARTCRVEPGVVLDQLNRALAPHALQFGPDVATSTHATIGGMIGNNSAGAHSILYGRTVEHLIALDCVMADGTALHFSEGAAMRDARVRDLTTRVAEVVRGVGEEIQARYPTIRRHVDGYNLDLVLDQIERSSPGTLDRVNLAHLMCGSEGTLAVTMQATLRLVPVPAEKGLAIVAFDDLGQALARLNDILETGPAAVELLDDVVISMAQRNTECRRFVELLPRSASGGRGAVLYVEYYADDPAELARALDGLEQCVAPNRSARYVDARRMTEAWALRKAGEPLLHGVPGPRKPISFIEDTAVNPARLEDFVKRFRSVVERHGTTAAYYAHASVGCLHIRPLIDLRDERDRGVMDAIAGEVTDLVREFGGALSGEHGDGRVRSQLLEQYFGHQICDALREIKRLFDPDNRLNPGIIVDPSQHSNLEQLRVQPDTEIVHAPEIDTFFRYEHGFGEALDQCNGAGVCRKTTGGTMCPSYRATLDERHATRGRGNALRLAITGQLGRANGQPSWNDPETVATLDLCLSCKACKSECPSNVDIAKLKSEYHAQRFRDGARPSLSIRAIGAIRRLNQLGSRTRWIANPLARLAPTRAILNRVMDVHPKRSVPRFALSLDRWMQRRSPPAKVTKRPAIVLLPDCFTMYNEPHIGQAAVMTLERIGYRVILPRTGCCGRAMISVGLLESAQRECTSTARDLLEAVERYDAEAIVGLEPSCVSAVCDDWLDLQLDVDDDSLERLAGMTHLIESFIEDRWSQHPGHEQVRIRESEHHLLLHGHCHQKALWGVETSAALLRRLVGSDRLTVLDSGCCGMAGAFGYAHHRYELSMAIGERSLFEPIRHAPECTIVVPGTSCRHQIRDGVGRRAVHPIEIASELIAVG